MRGPAIMGPLKEKGATGVQEKMEQMNRELAGVMARTGFAKVSKIDDSVVWKI